MAWLCLCQNFELVCEIEYFYLNGLTQLFEYLVVIFFLQSASLWKMLWDFYSSFLIF